MHAVREVDEGAALRTDAMAFSAARSGTMHSSMGKRDEAAERLERVAAIDQPGLGWMFIKWSGGGLEWIFALESFNELQKTCFISAFLIKSERATARTMSLMRYWLFFASAWMALRSS
jgi:hypothetical protein